MSAINLPAHFLDKPITVDRVSVQHHNGHASVFVDGPGYSLRATFDEGVTAVAGLRDSAYSLRQEAALRLIRAQRLEAAANRLAAESIGTVPAQRGVQKAGQLSIACGFD